MAATSDWLQTRGGELLPSANGRSWSVRIGGNLLYVLTLEPAGGKYSCRVVETNSGRRLDRGRVWPTAADAAQGGLNDLREALGW